VVVTPIDPELDQYAIDPAATERARAEIRATRADLLESDPADVAARYRSGELDMLDLIRQYGVIVDWGTGELFPETTRRFRGLLRKRSVAHWS